MQDIDQIRTTIRDFVERTALVTLADENIGSDANLYEAGILDSYAFVESIAFLEAEFKIKLSEEDLLSPELSSLEGMTKVVDRKLRGV